MPLYAAFLRGINLGRRRLTMDELKAAAEAFGLEGVATFIASGNVVFRRGAAPAELEPALEDHFLATFGYPVATLVRPFTRLRWLGGHHAIQEGEAQGFTPHVLFVRPGVTEPLTANLRALETPDDRFLALDGEVVWLRRGGLSDASIRTADLEKALGGADHTMRKLTTLRRMVTKFDPDP